MDWQDVYQPFAHVCEDSTFALALRYRNPASLPRSLALGFVEVQGRRQGRSVRWCNNHHKSHLAAHPMAQPQARRVVWQSFESELESEHTAEHGSEVQRLVVVAAEHCTCVLALVVRQEVRQEVQLAEKTSVD